MELDSAPPQVVIQALIAEVDLNNSDEFGVELGLQSPVLFRRGITPDLSFLGPTGTINYVNPGQVPPGVTVNSSINPAAQPGFNFNTTAALPGTQITFNARADQSAVRFEVSDQGVGIRKEHMPRLFEKFYRADDPVVRRTSGTGLGLYIVRSLVTMLGGQVHVRSRHGKGTVFTVILPRAEATTRTRPRVAVGAH